MRPEDIDKLFKERLGPSSPTPPADLWNRLQDRIETEMQSEKEEKRPKGFMWLSYSIAAAIALVLSVGIVFYNVQRGTVPAGSMAKQEQLIPEQPLIVEEPAADQGIAQTTAPETSAEVPAIPEPAQPVASPAQPEKMQPKTIASTARPSSSHAAAPKTTSASERVTSASVQQFVAQAERPVEPVPADKGADRNTGAAMPATFASASADMNAQPVEIIIKRAVAVQQMDADEELSGLEKKQKLAKNIFKQVRNLSNGERVELSELGINADRIALETQIGKQKISKVINL